MNTNNITFSLLNFFILGFAFLVYTEPADEPTPTVQKKNWSAKRKKETVTLNYVDEELIDIINQLAAEKGVNIVLPVGEESIEERVTLQMEDMFFEQAWDLLYVILEMAGYSMTSKGDLFTIVKTSPRIVTEPLPLYVGTPASDLPNIDEQIRYIYFLTNLKIGPEEKNEITDILNVVLPDDASILTNQNTNSIIITDTSRNVKSAMKIVHALDQTEFKEDYEVLPLRYISAESVASIFNDILGLHQPHRYRLDTRKKSEVSYFSRNIKIIAEPRTNSLLLLGRRQAIERVQNFIYQYIDVELDSGNSVLHVYQLQYLDAQEFAKTLQKIVSSGIESPTGQAQATGKTDTVERFFEGVIVRADTSLEEEPDLGTELQLGATKYIYYGGNKIIVAAKQEDWIRIRKLIEQLDTPQPQVIIEVLIADLTLSDTRTIASILRNPIEMAFPQDVDFQSAQASATIGNQTSGIITDALPPSPPNETPTTIQADLLRTGVFTDPDRSIASGFPAGTTLVSFNDRNTGQTWGLLELRQLFDSDKILSNPHVIATNNQRAEIIIGERRLLPDQSSGSEGGTTQVAKKWIDANLVLNITPRISSADTVNLNVEIEIDRFQDPAVGNFGSTTNNNPQTQAENTIDNRKMYTNANVHDQDVLALGGLTRVDLQKTISQWPVLGRIPILGYFLKDRNNENRKTNLSIFISPTIVQPRLRGGTSEYTQAYIDKSKEILTEGYLFESLQDPITRFFFGDDRTSDPIDEIDRFVSKDEFTQPSSEQFEDIRALAVVNLDTTKDNGEEKEICCSRQERMKKLVQQENNPLAQGQTSFNNESKRESSTRSK